MVLYFSLSTPFLPEDTSDVMHTLFFIPIFLGSQVCQLGWSTGEEPTSSASGFQPDALNRTQSAGGCGWARARSSPLFDFVHLQSTCAFN